MKILPNRSRLHLPVVKLPPGLGSLGPIGVGVVLTMCLFTLLHWATQFDLLMGREEAPGFEVELVRAQPTNKPLFNKPDPARQKADQPNPQAKATRPKSIAPTKPSSHISPALSNEPQPGPNSSDAENQPDSVPTLQLASLTATKPTAAEVPVPNANSRTSSPAAAAETKSIQALHRPAPRYPKRAHRRGIEGEVVVGFTVTSTGNVEQVRVIEAAPQGYFEDAALEAARRFRFSPQVIDGQAIAVADVRNRFSFRLRD